MLTEYEKPDRKTLIDRIYKIIDRVSYGRQTDWQLDTQSRTEMENLNDACYTHYDEDL